MTIAKRSKDLKSHVSNTRARKNIRILYFASLREEAGIAEETIEATGISLTELYDLLKRKHRFSLAQENLKVAINNDFVKWSSNFRQGDRIAFIPPVAGG